MESLPKKPEHPSYHYVYRRWGWNRWRPSAGITLAYTRASISEQPKTFNYFGCCLSQRNNNYGHTVLQNIQEIFGKILCLNKTKTLLKLSDNGSKNAPVRVWKLETMKKSENIGNTIHKVSCNINITFTQTFASKLVDGKQMTHRPAPLKGEEHRRQNKPVSSKQNQ